MVPDQTVLVALSAIAGLIWGSFLNVCIYRIVRDVSVVTPRSFCPACEHRIAWYDNIPVASYVFLRGRCRNCRARISLRYPLVEVVTALLIAAVVWRYGFDVAALKWIVWESLAVVLFCTDLEVRILPDEFTLGGIGMGALFALSVPVPSALLSVFFETWSALVRSLVAAGLGLVLPIPLWALAAVYRRVRGLPSEVLGLGDVKLVGLIGIFFGFERAIPVLMAGAVAGALFGLVVVAVRGRAAWQHSLPFGSFLCASAALFPLWRNASGMAG